MHTASPVLRDPAANGSQIPVECSSQAFWSMKVIVLRDVWPPSQSAGVVKETARENIENIDRYNRSAVWSSSQSTEVSVSAHD